MELDRGSFPNLPAGELHVWRIDIDHPPTAHERLAECLTSDERQRAERFHREADRARFIVSHSALRTILAGYLQTAPEDVGLIDGGYGKPTLAPSHVLPPLRFNLSHSAGMAMIAVVRDREVGIDVEHVRAIADIANITTRYFAPGEVATWRSLPSEDQLEGFFRCWTRKEAYLKARGVGLSLALDQFEVSFAPGDAARLIWCGDPADSAGQWNLYDVSPGAGYLAACVVAGEVERIQVYDWP